MRDSTSLPNLQIIPTDCLVPHEDCDPRRLKILSARLRKDGYIKNPPIAAPIPDTDHFIILDGANRVQAFQMLRIPHIIVQVVSYEDEGVILDTWYHIVSGLEIGEFENELRKVTKLNLNECTLEEARLALAASRAAAYIICDSGVRIVISPDGRLLNDIHLLNDIVGAYKGQADIFRASNDIWEIQKPFYPQITALIVFPRYSPADIITIAKNGFRVPSGVTRHVIPNRALHVNIPLEILEADLPLSRKEEWLHEWLMERMSANSIRFYSESTFSFDE